MKIEFTTLDRIQGKENRSKLLQPESELYRFLDRLRDSIAQEATTRGIRIGRKRMEFHIELSSKKNEDPEIFRKKAESLHGRPISLDEASFGFIRRAFVLWTPPVLGTPNRRTHITIAYFPGRVPPAEALMDVVRGCLPVGR